MELRTLAPAAGLVFAASLVGAGAVRAQEPGRVDVLRGDAARAIHTDLTARAANGFGGAAIVEKDGEVVLKAGYGWADRERRIPFTPATVAQVGSLTKQFTALAVADLERRGRLRFSDSLAAFFPGVPAQARGLTLHQLLTHTAGLVTDCGGDFERTSRDEITGRCLALPLVHAPGTKHAYSNLGYGVLGAVVEAVSGESLERYLEARFFAPLGMRRTGYFLPGVPADSFATGYRDGASQGVISDRLAAMGGDFWNLKGNGGMQASAEDMHRWYRALSGVSPGIADSLRAAVLRPYAARDSTVSYGYGWFIRTLPDGRVDQVSHTGGDGVFLSVFVWRPVDRLFFYLVGNAGDDTPVQAAREILRLFREAKD